jgi:hypothetical protein
VIRLGAQPRNAASLASQDQERSKDKGELDSRLIWAQQLKNGLVISHIALLPKFGHLASL